MKSYEWLPQIESNYTLSIFNVNFLRFVTFLCAALQNVANWLNYLLCITLYKCKNGAVFIRIGIPELFQPGHIA